MTAETEPQETGDDRGTCYLLHFTEPYHHARHYLGHATPGHLESRLADHAAGRGARLMEVIKDAGISFRLVRTWPGGRALERELKDRHEAPRLCPECSPQPRPAIPRRAPAPPPPVPAPRPSTPPRERGIRAAQRFLQDREGRPRAEIEAAFGFVTRPFRESGPRTAAAAEEMRAFTSHVTAALQQLPANPQAVPDGRKENPEMTTRSMKDPRVMSHQGDVEVRDFIDGPPGPRHPEADQELPPFDAATAARVRALLTDREREELAVSRDMTPGTPHPDPDLAARGWQASDHGTYIRKAPPELEREAE